MTLRKTARALCSHLQLVKIITLLFSRRSISTTGDATVDAAEKPAVSKPRTPSGNPTDGIALWALRHFAQKHSVQCSGKSTADVAAEVVAPATCARQCTYLDLLRGTSGSAGGSRRSTPAVALATVFVSHAWSGPFEDMIAALEAQFSPEGSEAVYLWIDVFSLPQCGRGCRCGSPARLHTAAALVGDVIRTIGRVVAVAEPFGRPRFLSRAWCLYEAHTAIERGAPLHVALSPAQRAAFLGALVSEFDSIAASLSRLDAREAEATDPRDRAEIFRAIESGCGFARLNEAVSTSLRTWLADSGREALAALPAAQRGLSPLYNQVAMLLRALGRARDAEALLRESLEAAEAEFGNADARTLTAQNNLALALKDDGRLGEAEPLARAALVASRGSLGGEHPLTLAAVGNLGTILQARGQTGQAEPLLREALEGQRAVLGDLHKSTLASLANLRMLLRDQGRSADGEGPCREALAAQRETLGDRHPETLASIGNLAMVLADQGKSAEAEPLLREALAATRETLGENHPDALTAAGNLAGLLQDTGRLDEAEPLFRGVLNAQRRILGEKHPDTLFSANNVAMVLRARGRSAEAEPMLRAALGTMRETLGAAHPDCAGLAANLAAVLRDQGKEGEAAQVERESG